MTVLPQSRSVKTPGRAGSIDVGRCAQFYGLSQRGCNALPSGNSDFCIWLRS